MGFSYVILAGVLADSFYKEFEVLEVVSLDKEVIADVFVAATAWVTLVVAKYFVGLGRSSSLKNDHFICCIDRLRPVSWILKLNVLFVARTAL